MSLMDALLLEEYHDPAQVWITQRADGQAGSATINDPADGGRITGAPISGTSVTYDSLTVLVVTHDPHGYSNGDSITFDASSSGGRSSARAILNYLLHHKGFESCVHVPSRRQPGSASEQHEHCDLPAGNRCEEGCGAILAGGEGIGDKPRHG